MNEPARPGRVRMVDLLVPGKNRFPGAGIIVGAKPPLAPTLSPR